MNSNEWENLAEEATTIQDAKNRVINGKLLELVSESDIEEDARIFDYGCGWGEWAYILNRAGFVVDAYDEADEMVAQAKEKFGKSVQFYTKEEFKTNLSKFERQYDLVTSNLVLCILEKEDQVAMLKNIQLLLKEDAEVIISFCHPCFDYDPEAIVSTRIAPEGAVYNKKFQYEKTIKENGLHFHDLHRPLEYFSELFSETGFKIIKIKESEVLETPYKPDFIIFRLKREV